MYKSVLKQVTKEKLVTEILIHIRLPKETFVTSKTKIANFTSISEHYDHQ